MRVALSEGRLSQWEQLLDELDHHQLHVLQAYARIEPWGDKRADMREAWLAAGIMGAATAPYGGEAPDPNALMHYMAEESATQNTTEEFTSPNAAAATMAQFFPSTIR